MQILRWKPKQQMLWITTSFMHKIWRGGRARTWSIHFLLRDHLIAVIHQFWRVPTYMHILWNAFSHPAGSHCTREQQILCCWFSRQHVPNRQQEYYCLMKQGILCSLLKPFLIDWCLGQACHNGRVSIQLEFHTFWEPQLLLSVIVIA